MIKYLPNALTILRIIIIPLVIVSFYFEDIVFAKRFGAILFAFAAITDFFDGFIARYLSAQSNFGRFLDPIADKLLVASSVVMLINDGRADVLPSIAIICREILVSGLREVLAEMKVSLPVSNLSKLKTALQMVAITLLLLGNIGSGIDYVDQIGRIVLWFAAGLTLFTGYAYLRAGIFHINKS